MKTINKIIKVLFLPFKLIFLGLIYLYKFLISPIIPHCCRFTPTCSEYMIIAVKRFGCIKGFILGIKRICRCTPKSQGGFDPVPVNMKGDVKWLL